MSKSFSEFVPQLRQFLTAGEEVLVLTHVFPDGDAVGSVLAFGAMLEQLGVSSVLAIDDAVPDKYRFLPGFEKIVNLKLKPLDRTFGRVAVLDAGSLPRVGAGQKGIVPHSRLLNIDHHFTGEDYGELNLVDVNASATSEILYELCEQLGLEITPQIGYGLYVGILTDTGRFRFTNTTPRGMQICSELIAGGIDPGWVTENVFYDMSLEMVRALAGALNNLEMHFNGRAALIGLSHDSHTDDTEGFVEYAASINGVLLAGFYSEMEPGRFKVSLRSRNEIDVCEIATRFGGGGHRKAAGFRFRGTAEDLKMRLLSELQRALETNGTGALKEVDALGKVVQWTPKLEPIS